MIDRHPALIVRCAGVADVIAAVNFARAHDLLVAVRGGGHSVPGFSMCDGGLVVDLSAMRSVRVDPVRRTARAEGGATWADFDHETQAFGLASTGGIASTTGIAGLTLGGGIGYLNRKYGLACDNLISADVVTADGRLLTASATENSDLFWALRGGGGNFGVVTSFEYQIHPVGPVLAGFVLWPFERANEVLRFYRESPSPHRTSCGWTPSSAPRPSGPAWRSSPAGAGDRGGRARAGAPARLRPTRARHHRRGPVQDDPDPAGVHGVRARATRLLEEQLLQGAERRRHRRDRGHGPTGAHAAVRWWRSSTWAAPSAGLPRRILPSATATRSIASWPSA